MMNKKRPTSDNFWVEIVLVALAAALILATVLIHRNAIAAEVEVEVTNTAVPGTPPATHIQVCTPILCSVNVTPGLPPGETATFTFHLPPGTYPEATLQAAAPATNLNWSVPVTAPTLRPLVVPPNPDACEADFTRDGKVTTVDFGVFFAEFSSAECGSNAE